MRLNEDEEHRRKVQKVAHIVMLFTFAMGRRMRKMRKERIISRISPEIRMEQNEQRIAYLRRNVYDSDIACLELFRMRRDLFFGLCTKLRNMRLLRDRYAVTVEEQVAMFLHTIGHNVRNRVVKRHFMRSGHTVSRYFNDVLYAIGELRHEYVKPPSIETSPTILNNNRYTPYFNNCIGAIDGTYIHARPPRERAGAFMGRKSHYTQNVFAAVDFNLRFTYVLAGWEGSAHDSTVLANAIEIEDGIPIPEGKFYLANAGYAMRRGFISPFRGVRYHLKEFSDNPPVTDKELFNHRHSSLRTTIERAFGALKNRFKILTSRPFFPWLTQVDIVLACCTLHNYIISGGLDSFVPTEDEIVLEQDEVQPSAPRGPRTDRERRHETQEWTTIRNNIMSQMWENHVIN